MMTNVSKLNPNLFFGHIIYYLFSQTTNQFAANMRSVIGLTPTKTVIQFSH